MRFRFQTFLGRCLLVSICALGALATLAAAALFFLFLHIRGSFSGTALSDVADCAVVFGAAVRSGSQAGPAIVRRVETAARLYNEGKVGMLYLTGGKGGGNRLSEAEVMRTFAVRHGVSPAHIVLEQQATSTLENIVKTRGATKQCQSVLAISDRYHLARISLLAGQQGWHNLRTFPADRRPPVNFETFATLREVAAYIYYSLHLTFLHIDEYDNPS